MDILTLQKWGRALDRRGVPGGSTLSRRLMRFFFHAYLPHSTEIGSGTSVGYGGIGSFFHPQSRIGRHCLISHYVTLGGRSGIEGGPVLGNYVRVGVGAKVLGPVKIGDFAVIGANAVVTRDVPVGAVVGGVPAKVIRRAVDPVRDYELATGKTVPIEERTQFLKELSRLSAESPVRDEALLVSAPGPLDSPFPGRSLALVGEQEEEVYA